VTDAGRLQHVSSGGLSLLVHGLFLVGLVFSVSWNNPPLIPVQADLWTELPEPPPAAPILDPPPAPEPLPAPEPPPPVQAAPEQVDIALEKAERKKREEARRLEESRLREERQAELKRQEELRQQEELKRQEETRKQEELRRQQDRERQEKEKREQARRQVEQDIARQMREDLEAERAQLNALQERSRASRHARVVDDFKLRIQAKIQAYVRLPHRLTGNPEAVFEVSLLPNGEVVRAVLVKSSGQPAYDTEVERAILKASPLPLPPEREAAQVFREGLILKFRPSAEAGGGA
jgi:colicin import membrane protein